MELSRANLEDKEFWTSKGYELPSFDVKKVRDNTLKNPMWLHFGAGNIFRAYIAVLQQKLLNEGLSDRGIIACEFFDEEIIDKAYKPFDNLSIAVTLKSDGNIDKKIVASVVDSIVAKKDLNKLFDIVASTSLEIISFTITEKGYSLTNSQGKYFKEVLEDLEVLPKEPKSIMGLIALLCFKRYKKNKAPLTLLSLDNCFHNGLTLFNSVKTFADTWVTKGYVEKEFINYLSNNKYISFPWSMIDKITPRPSESVKKILQDDGINGVEIIETSKHTYISSFVNAEEVGYLIIEDSFPNGRPPLEKAGVIFTDRETVDKAERMKVCTCLNPLHSILAIFGCLLGYNSVAKIMEDKTLRTLLEKAGYDELLPVVVDPKVINPHDFMREVLEKRFPNPYVPDTPQRIACDTSQIIPIRFGETLKSYLKRNKDTVKKLTFIPLFFAGWLRYLMAIDDEGKPFDLSPDPLNEELTNYMKKIKLGDKGPFTEILRPILSNKNIFAVDLYECVLAEKVEQMFSELVGGKGMVKKTLDSYVNDKSKR